ncbi:MAG: YkgJ family cysteine cluster protein [Nitrospirae bacterium]|nr:YkgJ family cysteine cluster protein [Nitrospirota bacterium]
MNGACKRCGECCRRSSPTLHLEDRALVLRGVIPFRYLYTLRKGEKAFDNLNQTLVNLQEELIKVKEKGDTRECIFFDPLSSSCTIYEHRPLQCRVFLCSRPEHSKALSKRKKLQRTDLVSNPEILTIIDAHNQRVDMAYFIETLESLSNSDRIRDETVELILYDLHFREFIKEKLPLNPDEIQFYLGRSLYEILKDFGIELDITPL